MSKESRSETGPEPAPAESIELSALNWTVCAARTLWLCGFATVTLLVAAFAFIFNDQGQDLLRILSDPTGSMAQRSPSVAAFLSAIAWSLSTWYTSRLLTIRKLPGFHLPTRVSARIREWVPRILGALAPLVLALGFLRLGAMAQAAVYVVLSVVLLIFYWKRRKWFPKATGSLKAGMHLVELPLTSRIIVGVAIALSFLMLMLFVAAPVSPARLLGTEAVFVLAATSIVLFGSIVLNYLPLSNGYPGLLPAVLIWSVGCSIVNDNHPIRTAIPQDGVHTAWSRDTPAIHFSRWLEKARAGEASISASQPKPRYPVFIVAAAGGGIRAAYWAAAVLGSAAQKVAEQNGDDLSAWRHHLYALSGVSGGSLGTTVHVAELQQHIPASKLLSQASGMLGEDHLSPVVAFMSYPDLLQRFVPYPLTSFDRARALETSWEASGDEYLGKQLFSNSFRNLWSGAAYDLPALLLNSTRVETGQRVIVSNLVIPGGSTLQPRKGEPQEFLDAVDLIGLTSQVASANGSEGAQGKLAAFRSLDDIRLSSAIHLSARFTYVSPAARVERVDGSLWGRLVDGGYFENSGAATAADLIRYICPDWEDGDSDPGNNLSKCGHGIPDDVMPVVLLIKNDPHAASLCDTYSGPDIVPRAPFTEIKPPVSALLATREARGRLAERAIVRLVEGGDTPLGDCRDGCVLEFSLAAPESPPPSDPGQQASSKRHLYNDPPLGWSLSESSRKAMDQRLADADIQGQLACIANLASGKACTTTRKCAVSPQ